MKNKRAFTLIEILVVILIIGIIVLVGIPAFNNFYQMYKFRSSMNQLVIDIRAARQLALTVNRPVKITQVDTSDYNQAGNSTLGYAIYILKSNDIEADGGTLTNWEEAAPKKAKCGELAEKPRFLPYPVSFLTPSGSEITKWLKDIDQDNLFDIVFLPNGQMYPGPYPPVSGDDLLFSEDPDNPRNNTPRIIMKTDARIAKNRYLIYFSLSGKVGVEPYHE